MPGWKRLRERLRDPRFKGRPLLLGLDFDGTLAALAPRPERASLQDSTKSLLVELSRRRWIKIAVLSGRTLPDLKSKVGLKRAFYAGNHGLEIMGPGKPWVHPRAARFKRALSRAAADLRPLLERFPGAWLENKGLGLAVHYRAMPANLHGALEAALRRLLVPMRRELRLAPGKKVWEAKPRAAWNKGLALELIKSRLPGSWNLMFIGDDDTDEEGFAALGKKALTVRLGRAKITSAEFVLRDRRYVELLLHAVLETFHDSTAGENTVPVPRQAHPHRHHPA
ncbi:MAG: trehalose-phosphatase [Elusimicrobia bacterium]|nr:trehalose-phosphatase [Elusimicrobiota bacterium]